MACGAAALLGMGLLPGTALAGANWIDLNRFHTSAGQRMSGEAVFSTRSKATEIRSRGPYFLYAAPESAGYRLPDPADSATVRLARIQVAFPGRNSRFKGFDKHNPRGLLDFTMPDMAPGDYYISACNRACTSQLADLSTTCCLEVAANPTEARLNARIDRLATRLTTSTGSVRDDFRGPKKRLWRELAAVEGATSGAWTISGRTWPISGASRASEASRGPLPSAPWPRGWPVAPCRPPLCSGGAGRWRSRPSCRASTPGEQSPECRLPEPLRRKGNAGEGRVRRAAVGFRAPRAPPRRW